MKARKVTPSTPLIRLPNAHSFTFSSKGVRGTFGKINRGTVLPNGGVPPIGRGVKSGTSLVVEPPKRGEERGRLGPITSFPFFFFFFFFFKKTIHLRGEWCHQIGVLGEFKRGLNVAHGDWFGVREGTHLLGEHPLHPNHSFYFFNLFSICHSFLAVTIDLYDRSNSNSSGVVISIRFHAHLIPFWINLCQILKIYNLDLIIKVMTERI
ncbi:hypothetical protein Hanom_Chr09g00848701 [Helianthus anomalus]